MNAADMTDDHTHIDERYLADWSGLRVGCPSHVFRPTTTIEVAAIVRQCQRENRRITVQGGLTGVAGGAVPSDGDVVINLERMNQIEDIDALEGVMQVQAGAVLQDVQEAALAHGWMFAVDLGARGSCQIGGNASTNAGGIRVMRFGPMRDSVLGVEAVLADGSIVSSLTRLIKNSTGTDPRHLFIGSEGTLGIITRLTLRLHPPMGEVSTAWASADHFDALPHLLYTLKRALGTSLCAYEFMSGRYVSVASQLTGQAPPVKDAAPWHVLIEASAIAGHSMQEPLQNILMAALESGQIRDCAVATSVAHQESFWRLREAVPEILTHLKPAATLDLGLPWKETASYIKQAGSALKAQLPDAEHLFLGHLGDNNIHIISGPVDVEGLHTVDEIAYAALRGRGGTISAEHGVGRLKKAYLPVSRNAGELALMRCVKGALDPAGILNPGRIID